MPASPAQSTSSLEEDDELPEPPAPVPLKQEYKPVPDPIYPRPEDYVFYPYPPFPIPVRSRTPPLPLSPVSNPASPYPRKRARPEGWNPPDHVPDFLPPFPTERPPSPPMLSLDNSASGPHSTAASTPLPNAPLRPPSPSPPPAPSTSQASYKNPVPYATSTLASKPNDHLPKSPDPLPPFKLSNAPHGALLNAQHQLLTHPPSSPGGQNPARHTLAMSLILSSQSRYVPSDTLFGASDPTPLKSAVPMPSFPIPLNPEDQKKGIVLPQETRSVVAGETIAPQTAVQSSRLPALARGVLPVRSILINSRLSPIFNSGCSCFLPSLFSSRSACIGVRLVSPHLLHCSAILRN